MQPCEECGAINIPNVSTGCKHHPCNQMEAILERYAIVVQECTSEHDQLETYAAYLLNIPRSEANRILEQYEANGKQVRLRKELNRQRNASAKNNT